MLNSYSMSDNRSYNKTVVSTHVNAVTGNITKTYRDSFFKEFSLNTETGRHLLSREPNLYDSSQPFSERQRPAVVIQMVLIGDGRVIAEIMWQDDYNKLFEEESAA